MHWTAGFRRGLPRKLDIALRAGKDAVLQFVFENSQPVSFSGCWLWMGPVQENGYGYIVDPRRPFNRASPPRMIVPRLVCETVHGKMPTAVARRLYHEGWAMTQSPADALRWALEQVCK